MSAGMQRRSLPANSGAARITHRLKCVRLPQISGVEVWDGQAYNQRQNGGIPGRPVASAPLRAHAAINIPAKRSDDEQR